MKIILFDFDGVIADTYSFCYRISNLRTPSTHEEYRAKFEGNINDAVKKTEQAKPDAEPFDFFAHYTPELMKCPPNDEMVEVIRELAREHTLIIVSSTLSQPIAEYFEAYGLKDAFTEILGNDVERSKVKKINDIIRRYDIDPSDTVMITDTLGDIKEADACGVRSIAVTWGYHRLETLTGGNPFAIISSPKEILGLVQSMERTGSD